MFEILTIVGPSSLTIDHDKLQNLLTFIMTKPQFKEFVEKEAPGLNITTPMHVEELSYKLLNYIVNEARKEMGGGTRYQRKNSKRYTRKL